MALSLLENGTRLCKRSMVSLDKSEALLQHSDENLARSRFALQQHMKRRTSSSLLPVIRLKLHDGRLPHTGAPIIVGHPGDGGLCGACGKVLLKNQLEMDVPSREREFVHLHAGCYILWNAERCRDTDPRVCV